MMEPFCHFSVESGSVGKVGKIVFDAPDQKVNTLSRAHLEELEQILDSLPQQGDLKALLLTSNKPNIFIAGADLKGFEALFQDKSKLQEFLELGHRVFNKLQALPIPSIAIIDGACVGGGLELALACTYRIATDNPKTVLGLPEVSLGLIPAWGGTQRLPRLIGLSKGMEIILAGKTVPAIKAWKLHMVDVIASPPFLEEAVQKFLLDLFNRVRVKAILARRSSFSLYSLLLEKNPLGRKLLYSQAEKAIKKRTQGRYPAPLLALNAIRNGYPLSLRKGLQAEVKTVLDNLDEGFSLANKLIKLFLVGESLKKDVGAQIAGLSESTQPDLKMASTAVIGAGTMGNSIAWLFAKSGYSVRLKDLNWELLGAATKNIQHLFSEAVKRKKMTADQASLGFHELSCTTDDTGFQFADLALECATENLELKLQLLKKLESVIPEKAIIATNTSSLTVEELSKPLIHPERFVALHFFNPADRMPLVEVVAGKATRPEVLASAIQFCRTLGKTPLVVGDCAGFLVNRILALGLNEVMWMLQEGISMDQIEKVIADFGLPMSPFILSDQVGNDVTYKVSKSFEKAYGERMHCPEIVYEMYMRKLYGKKCGKGFYLYQGKRTSRNPEIEEIIVGFKPERSVTADREIRDRFVLVMVGEALRCLHEKVVLSADYLDMALILGMGFPPFRGGLLAYARDLGQDYVAQMKDFEARFGPRFKVENGYEI